MDCFVEIICVSSVIWFVLHNVLNIEFTKKFIIVPIATFAIGYYLLVGRFDEKYLFGTGILYFLLPVLLTKNVRKMVILYAVTITTALTYFIFGFVYFIFNIFQISK